MNDQRTQKINLKVASTRPAIEKRFEVLSVLGDGSAAFVYKVKDRQKSDQIMALKVLVHADAFDGATKERFIDELRIAQAIKHPNIVAAYELINVGDTVAYTMELVDGVDLSRFMERGQRFDIPTIDLIVGQILSALSVLHLNKVLHRDLKLENILFDEKNRMAKISDLGLMKIGDAEGFTRFGTLLGTVSYFPPEYVSRYEYDERSDIWAVGIILFELISHRRRLPGMSGVAAIEYLKKTQFALPNGSLDGVSPRHLYVLSKALALDRADRFQTAAEMLHALEHGPEAPPPPPEPVELKPQISLQNFERTRPPSAKRRLSKNTTRLLIGASATMCVALGIPLWSKVAETLRAGPAFAFGTYESTTKKGTVRVEIAESGAELMRNPYGCPDGAIAPGTSTIRCDKGSYTIKLSVAPEPDSITLSLREATGRDTVNVQLKKIASAIPPVQ